MSRVLVAGSTGYLGRELLRALHAGGHQVIALSRPQSVGKLDDSRELISEVREGDAADPGSLGPAVAGVDTVVSTVGLTKAVKGLTFDQVDFGGNMNLLSAAIDAGVGHFAYVSLAGVDLPGALDVDVVRAKKSFEDALRASRISWSIARPSGFFWNYGIFLTMARKHGVVPMFGSGAAKTTPIDEGDLADAITARLGEDSAIYTVGGPQDLTGNEVADLIQAALGKRVRVLHIPDKLTGAGLRVLQPFSPSQYGMWSFFHWATTAGATADHVGAKRLGGWLAAHRDEDFAV